MTLEAWRELRGQMAQADNLPKPAYHMQAHGEEFVDLGIKDARQLESFFLDHIRRPDLAYFTYVSTKQSTQYRMWAMIAMDNGVVALYNESLRRHWSFMRLNNLPEYLGFQSDWWVSVEEGRDKVKVQRWRKP